MIPQQTPTVWEATHMVQMSCGLDISVKADSDGQVTPGSPVIHNCNTRRVDSPRDCRVERSRKFV